MNKILIVVDMQKDFVSGVLGSKEALVALKNASEKIKNFDGDIFLTLDTHFSDYLDTEEGKNLPVPHCIKGTDGWQLEEEILKALDGKEYKLVEKYTFGSVDLPNILKQRYDVDDLDIELIGVCTDICVVSNAMLLKANFTKAKISVDSSCCAGVTPKLHQDALSVMGSCQIKIK